MWFLVGVLLGSTLAGGPQGGGAALGSIPLRCFMALEESAEAYMRCRRPSLIGELAAGSSTYPGSGSACWAVWSRQTRNRHSDGLSEDAVKEACDVQWHLSLEVRALTRLNEMAAQQAKQR